MRRTIAALAARKYSGPYRANLKPPAMPGVMTLTSVVSEKPLSFAMAYPF